LHIEDLDIVDGTPLLDIKPYVPRFDERTDVRTGWLEENGDRLEKTRDDGRFIPWWSVDYRCGRGWRWRPGMISI